MSDAWSAVTNPSGGVKVTIKTGKGYDDTWITFEGEGLRQEMADFFGMDSASVAGLTNFEVVVNATQIAHGMGAVANRLGGTVITKDRAKAVQSEAPAPVAKDEPEAEGNPLLAQIAATTNVEALKRLWAENQPLADDVMAAWKARGKALKDAA